MIEPRYHLCELELSEHGYRLGMHSTFGLLCGAVHAADAELTELVCAAAERATRGRFDRARMEIAHRERDEAERLPSISRQGRPA